MTRQLRSRCLRLALTAIVSATTLAAVPLTLGPADAAAAPKPPVKTNGHLLAINDFHGNIDPPVGSGGLVNGTPAGGVEYLATTLKTLRQQAGTPNVLTVSAGDSIGGTPLVSAAFHDEPTIEELNTLGLDVSSVGNHEFDEGVTELLRMQNGGCHPVDGCQDGDGFAGADFPYLAANVVYRSNNRPILPPYAIKTVGNKRIGFIGMTLEGTPSIVNPAGISTVKFLDEATTANKYAGILRKQGIKTIVLLLHEGGAQSGPPPLDINGCSGFAGDIVPVIAGLQPIFKLVVTGHTHRPYICNLPNRSGATSLVTSAGSFGTIVTDISFTLGKNGNMISASARNVIVENGIRNPDGTWLTDATGAFVRNPALVDPAAKALADKFRTAVAPIANAIVGTITADITRTANAAGESSLGDVIADGMLAYARTTDGAEIAFMNPGGIRADLSFANSPGGEAPGQVTYGEVFTVQPFNNLVTTQTFTGAQIKDVLEQQFVGFGGQTVQRILQVSAGFTYDYDSTGPAGAKVSNIQLNGVPIDPAGSYRVVSNDFLANGGDGFTNLGLGTDRSTSPGFDVDSLAAYLGAGPVSPGPVNRITKLG